MATPRKPRPPRAAPAEIQMSVAAHPRAAEAVRRAKGAGALIGLVLSAALARHAGLPAFDAGLRAVIGGIAGYVVFWTVAVQAARHLVVAEARAAGKRLATERREREEQLAGAASAAGRDATRNGTPA